MKVKLSDHPTFVKEWDREKIVNTCNAVPWHIVPADKNWQKLHFVADVVLKTLEKLDLKWPELVTEKFKTTKKTE